MTNSYLRVPSSLQSTRKSPSTCSWMGHLVPHLYFVREAILDKPTRRDWDSMNCPQPFHIELQLIVKVTGAFLKGGLTRVLRMVSVILHAMWEGCLIRAWNVEQEQSRHDKYMCWKLGHLSFSISSHSFLLVPALLCLVLRQYRRCIYNVHCRVVVPWTLLATTDCLCTLCNKLLISKKKKTTQCLTLEPSILTLGIILYTKRSNTMKLNLITCPPRTCLQTFSPRLFLGKPLRNFIPTRHTSTRMMF